MGTILCVCTGNINRSALTAALLRRSVGDLHQIASAGLTADGLEPPPRMLKAAARHGVDLTAHRSRRLSAGDTHVADLILCMDRTHPVRIAAESADALDRTMLLTEATQVLEPNVEGLAAAVATAAAQRPARWFLSPVFPDIDDPMGRRQRAFDRAADHIATCCDELAIRLRHQ